MRPTVSKGEPNSKEWDSKLTVSKAETVAKSGTDSSKRWDFQWQREKLTAKVWTEN